MSNELLQKVIDTGTNSLAGNPNTLVTTGADGVSASGGNGLLYPDQANRFLDYMWDATILAKAARTIRMRSNTTEIDRVSVGQQLMRVASEDNPRDWQNSSDSTSNYTSQGATFSKISLTTKKLRLDWELSAEALEDNIEGPDLEDHIARLMATQAGNDIEDLLINGNGSSGNLYIAFKGFRKLAVDNAHVVDAAGAGLDRTVFNNAIKTLPRKYKQRRNQLRFFAGSNLVQDYLYNLTASAGTVNPWDIASGIVRGDVAANDGGPGVTTPFAFGIPVINVPLMREDINVVNGEPGTNTGTGTQYGDIHLTFPQNFIVGIKRDVVVYRVFQPKKDTIEYTLFIRVGTAIENYDAHVIVKNIAVGGTAPNFGSNATATHGSGITGGTGGNTF
jgi:hypothetical protein